MATPTAKNPDTNKQIQKDKQVYEIFKFVAPFYDTCCEFVTFGLHRLWRNRLIKELSPCENMELIDMAGGTGKTAFYFLDYVKKHNLQGCHVTVCDINDHMLKAGKEGKKAKEYHPDLISWVQDNAESTSFQDCSFNAYCICMGIRNCSNYKKVLEEAFRILQPGSKFVVVEMVREKGGVLTWLNKFVVKNVLHVLEYFVGNGTLSQYAMESLDEFPDKNTFKTMIEETGFQDVDYESLFLDIRLYVGIRP